MKLSNIRFIATFAMFLVHQVQERISFTYYNWQLKRQYGHGTLAGGADMTSTTLANVTPEVWSAKANVTYRAKTVLVPLMDHSWENELGVGRGDIVNVYGFTQNNSPNNRGAGTGTFGTGATTTFDAVTEGQTQIAVNRLYYKAHRKPVEAQAQVMPGYWSKIIDGEGEAIQLQIDADLASDNTNGIDAATTVIGTDNVDLTEDDFISAETTLHNQNAPLDGRYAVLSPASYASARKIEAFRNTLYGNQGALAGNRGAGYAGMAGSLAVYMSNNLEAGTAGKKNGIFHQEAIAFIEQLRLQTASDLNIEDGLFNQHVTYNTCGFKIMKTGVLLEADGK